MTKAASWGGFGKVLANLVVHRCRVIPLVSQAFRCVHNDYPPQRKALKLEHPITRGMIVWFNKTASSLERLEVDLRGDVPGCLSQMLAMAAITAPNLDDLKVCTVCDDGALLSSISLLSQIKKLSIGDLAFPKKGGLADLQNLSGLQSLEVDPLSPSEPYILMFGISASK